MVGPVWFKNHIEVKLMARPSSPLAVATTQNIGILITSLSNDKHIRKPRGDGAG